MPQLWFCLWNTAKQGNNEPFYQRAANKSWCKQALSTGISRNKRSGNERPLSLTVHAPNQLKQLPPIHYNGVAERKSFFFLYIFFKHNNWEEIRKLYSWEDRVQLWEIVSCSSEFFSWCYPQILLSLSHQSSQKLVKHLRGRDYTTVELLILWFLWQRKDFWTRSGH